MFYIQFLTVQQWLLLGVRTFFHQWTGFRVNVDELLAIICTCFWERVLVGMHRYSKPRYQIWVPLFNLFVKMQPLANSIGPIFNFSLYGDVVAFGCMINLASIGHENKRCFQVFQQKEKKNVFKCYMNFLVLFCEVIKPNFLLQV